MNSHRLWPSYRTKNKKTVDDQNMIDAIDHLIRVRLEREYAK